MAWQYSDWNDRQYTGLDRRDRLASHVREVSDRLSGLMSSATAGNQSQRYQLEGLLTNLQKRLDEIDAELGLTASGSADGGAPIFVETRVKWGAC